jgi:hypothetical protein
MKRQEIKSGRYDKDKQERNRGKKIKRERREMYGRRKIPAFLNGENQFPLPRMAGYYHDRTLNL